MCLSVGGPVRRSQIARRHARCTRDIFRQQRLVVATGARALLIELYQTVPSGPEGNPPALRRPDRRGVEVDGAKRQLLFAAPHQVDQPDVGNAHFRINQ